MKRSTLERKSRADLVALRALIDDIIAEKDGKPRENAISGRLLRDFDADWPRGWVWPNEPPYMIDEAEAVADYGGLENAPPLLDDGTLYDMTDEELEFQVEFQVEPYRVASFWDVFKPWFDKRAAK